MPVQPAHPRPDRPGSSGGESARQGGLDPVRAGVPASHGFHPETAGRRRPLGGFPTGRVLGSVHRPAGRAGGKGAVRNQVRPRAAAAGAGARFDVVHEKRARSEREDLKSVGRARTVVQRSRALQQGPRRLPGFVAVGPVRRPAVVGPGIDQFQAAAAAVGPASPAAAVAVPDLVDHDENAVGFGNRAVGAHDPLGSGQGEAFTAVGQGAGEVPERVFRREPGMAAAQSRGIPRHHEIPAGSEPRPRRKLELDAVHEPPSGEIDRRRSGIEQLHVLAHPVRVARRVEHDLVDHHRGRPRRRVREAGRRFRQFPPDRAAFGMAAERDAVGLRPESYGVDHPGAVGTVEEQGLAGGVEREAQLRLVEGDPPARGQHGSRGNQEAGLGRVVGDPASGEIDGVPTSVADLDEIQLRFVRVGEQFVEADPGEGGRWGGGVFGASRGSSDPGARRPGARVGFPERRPGEDEGRSAAVGRGRPGNVVGVADVEEEGAGGVEEAEGSRAVGEPVRAAGQDAGQAVHRFEVARGRRHDHEPARRHAGRSREHEGHFAFQSVPAQVFGHQPGVLDLHELQVPAVGSWRRMVLDFGDRPAGAPAARSGGIGPTGGGAGEEEHEQERPGEAGEERFGTHETVPASHRFEVRPRHPPPPRSRHPGASPSGIIPESGAWGGPVRRNRKLDHDGLRDSPHPPARGSTARRRDESSRPAELGSTRPSGGRPDLPDLQGRASSAESFPSEFRPVPRRRCARATESSPPGFRPPPRPAVGRTRRAVPAAVRWRVRRRRDPDGPCRARRVRRRRAPVRVRRKRPREPWWRGARTGRSAGPVRRLPGPGVRVRVGRPPARAGGRARAR
jgi:hypothetical protein